MLQNKAALKDLDIMAWFKAMSEPSNIRADAILSSWVVQGIYYRLFHSSEKNLEYGCGQNSAFEKILDFGPQFIVNLKVLLVVLIPQRPRWLKVSGRKGCVCTIFGFKLTTLVLHTRVVKGKD